MTILALMLAMAGCTPSGPRALLKGKKYLDAGENAAAVAQFKTATTLLATNAAAWNYYGVALQRNGQPDDAANAYRRALDLDRELLDARLNLGSLYLEQNQPDAAKTEFTAYTLRRPNDAAGWLKLGSAQLKLNEVTAAERSFSTVLSLKTSEAEAYNGLGLARVQRNKPREAAQFFTAAVQAEPDCAPALLNLATVNQQYLHDNKTARIYFEKYLTLTPRPANWDAVKAIADSLEEPPAVAATPQPQAPVAPAPKPAAPVQVAAVEPKTAAKPTNPPAARLAQSPRAQSEKPAVNVPAAPPQLVQVAPEPQIVTAPNAAAKPVGQPAQGSTYVVSGVTTLEDSTAPRKPAPVIVPPTPVNFPRYQYVSPRKPAAGDRRRAGTFFTQAQAAEKNQNWTTALQDYLRAAAVDPSWFEAQYNSGVLAQRLRNYPVALGSFESALALQPDSVNTRFNFALALKAAGYAPDAQTELQKILAASPNEVRAHLALANLCAQSLHDPAQARKHYLKVLELDPANPQASDIRFWLAANPQ